MFGNANIRNAELAYQNVLEKALLEVQTKIINEKETVNPVIPRSIETKVDENIATLNESLKSEMNKSIPDEEKSKN